MKKLYLIRHAKSDRSDMTLTDHQRGLNKRGKQNIPLMGEMLKEKNIKPDLIISSSAKRAKLTAKGLAKSLKYDHDILYLEQLYFCEPMTWIETVRAIDKEYESVFIVGHNPEITDLCNMLIDDYINNVPTLGIVAFKVGIKKWKKFEREKTRFEFFIYPKMFKERSAS